jgi:hypothetical protein
MPDLSIPTRREPQRLVHTVLFRVSFRRAAAFGFLLALVFAAACSDTVLSPTTRGDSAASAVSAAFAPVRDARAFPCRTSQATPLGEHAYRYGTATLYFPQAALAPNGATIRYRVRYQEAGAQPVAVFNCIIPNTDLAIGLGDRSFGAQHGVKVRVGRTRGGVTTLGCVKAGECSLEAIDVVVPPSSTEPEDPCARGACWDRYGGDGSSGSYYWGGDGSDPGSPDEPGAGDDAASDSLPPDCAQPRNVLEAVYCQAHPPTAEQRVKMDSAMERMRRHGGPCSELADALGSMLAAGHLRVYDNADGTAPAGGASGQGGDWTWLDAAWFGTWETTLSPSGRNLAGMIAHEMDHHLNHVVTGVTDSDGHRLKADGTSDPYHTLNSRECAV